MTFSEQGLVGQRLSLMYGSLHAATGARRRRSWNARAVVALLLVAVGAGGAAAVTPVTVNVAPGAEVIIDSSDQPLVNKTTKARGTITMDQAGTPPAVHRLLYRAPTDVNDDLVEVIEYQKASNDLVASVHVNKVGEKTQSLAVGGAFKVLAILFVLAVLLEQALSVIFNWRPFLQNFDARGVKTVVSVLAAWLVLETFQLDLVRDLVTVYTGTTASSGFSTKLLTAMILAGGSSGVNNVLVSLGFRSTRSADQIAPRPPPTEAWLAVRLIRKEVVGNVTVSIGPDKAILPVVGTIAGSSSKNRLLRYFLVDRGRFPMVGGHSLRPEAGTSYKVEVAGVTKDGTSRTKSWGGLPIAAGAMIDIDIEL